MKRMMLLALAAVFATSAYASPADKPLKHDPNAAADTGKATRMDAADVAGILMVASQGEIEQAQKAMPNLNSEAARDFADMMIRDHTTALNESQSIFKNTHIVPRENNAIAGLMKAENKRIVKSVSSRNADRAYMEAQVTEHKGLLNTIDNTLVPASRGDLLNLLRSQRETVSKHLDRANEILNSLQ